jgi:hypothetical protein
MDTMKIVHILQLAQKNGELLWKICEWEKN